MLRSRRRGKTWYHCLQNAARLLALANLLGLGKSKTCRTLEDLCDTLVGLGGTFEVVVGADDLLDMLTLLLADRLLGSLCKLRDSLGVISEILLAADKDDGEVGTEVKNFGDPLLLHVVQGIGRVDGEADQDDMRIGIGERAETVVVLLTSRIPQGKLNMLSINVDIGDVVLENSGDVHLREGSLGEDNQ